MSIDWDWFREVLGPVAIGALLFFVVSMTAYATYLLFITVAWYFFWPFMFIACGLLGSGIEGKLR